MYNNLIQPFNVYSLKHLPVGRCFFNILQLRLSGAFHPIINITVLNSREQPLFDTRIFHIELSDKLFYIFAPRVAIVRAWILAHRQIIFILKALHI